MEFVRQVGCSESACGYVWLEDIQIDVLGQHFAVIAQKYYRRRWKLGGLTAKPMQSLLHISITNI